MKHALIIATTLAILLSSCVAKNHSSSPYVKADPVEVPTGESDGSGGDGN